jgi:DNA-binding transcriptional MocR family regulator
MALLDHAISEERLAFVPGRAFAVDEAAADRCMRLSFSNVTPARIDEGVAALGRVVAGAAAVTR